MRLIAVIMGTKSEAERAKETLSLLNYGFRFYEAHRLHGAGETLAQLKTWKGTKRDLPVGVAADLSVMVPRGQHEGISTRFETEPRVVAPVARGQVVGKVLVEQGGKVVREAPLVALEDIPLGGWFRRLIDTILLWFN
jgi:D-alanyl-D-alanine carboxypeptidase (penicillin-binding protein 5/6)